MWPNLSESGMSQAIGNFVAMHQFKDGAVWLLKQTAFDGWVKVREAADVDWETFASCRLLTIEGKRLLAKRIAERQSAGKAGSGEREG